MARGAETGPARAGGEPTDLLSARAGAHGPTGFFDRPGVRKFVRNRSGVAAFVVIGLFILLAAAIALPPHLIRMSEAQQRVGPASLPGLGRVGAVENRIEIGAFLLGEVRKALKASDPAAALGDLRFAELGAASMTPAEARAALSRGDAALSVADDALYVYEDAQIALDQLHGRGVSGAELAGARAELDRTRAACREAVGALEAEVGALFPRPTGWSGLVYKARLIAGTDRQGRSIAVRAIYSVKTATQIGMVTALFSVVVGAVLGGAAGFFGGIVDHAVVWLYSLLSSIPYIIWLVVIAFVFRESDWTVPVLGKPIAQTLFPVYLAFGVTLWVGTCRVVRGEAMKIKGLDYIQAAVSIGAGPVRILMKHVLPNVMYLLFINFSLAFVAAIKGEVILSYLGLGVQGQPSWGIMIRDSKDDLVLGSFWQLGAATLMMFILVYAFNILSDALQDAFDPKHVG